MDDKERFIAGLYPAARKVSRETGMAWETILAQAAQETGWGKRVLPGTNNLFNIKADAGWHGPSKTFNVWEIEGGKKVWKDQPFRVYGSIEEALGDRVQFLKHNPRYAKAGLFAADTLGHFEKEAAALQKAGYATDPAYARSLIAVFNGATMQRGIRLAEGQVPANTPATRMGTARSEAMLQVGMHGPDVHHLQVELNQLGYRDAHGHALKPDGDFGERTKQALQAFQRAHGIDPVGLVGPHTRAALHQAGHHPTPVDPAHPDHALHRQSVAAVHRLDAGLGHHRDEHSERLEAGVTRLARENGITRIDHVVLRNGTVFVVEGGLDDPARRIAHMPVQTALATPVAESFQQLASLPHAHSNATPHPAHAPFEHQEGPRRVPPP